MIEQYVDSDELDLDDPGVDPHTMIEIPVYGLPQELPEGDRVRVMIAGISRGLVRNELATVMALLFDAGAFKVTGWKLEAQVPVEFQAVSNGAVR